MGYSNLTLAEVRRSIVKNMKDECVKSHISVWVYAELDPLLGQKSLNQRQSSLSVICSNKCIRINHEDKQMTCMLQLTTEIFGGIWTPGLIIVHNIIARNLQVDYPWTIEPNPDSEFEYDSETSPPPIRQDSSLLHGYVAGREHELLTKFLDDLGLSKHASALFIGGQKFQSIRRYHYAQATLDDWMKSKQYSIQDVLRMKPGFIIPEVMAWFTGQHKTHKSSLNKQSCVKIMLQLIFDREPMHDTPSALTYRAISNCNVQTRRYTYVQDIEILFNHWTTQPTDDIIQNQDHYIKFVSIFLKVLFLRTTKISGVDLNLSNFNFGNYVALPTLLTQNNQCFKTIRSEKNRNTESLPQCNSLYVVISIKRTFLLSVNNFSYTVLNQTMEIKVSCENF
ncbi:MAG: hypothetical protein EZS28_002404 [Streblomastix strix]|uniref:Uncharacterized protein n=1 Tax=Streblomastix strix TaxID=222440 RepID=A0A5J4X4G2_9EUKA|nr:MAG: hypothetical protein EZS28_002404 [Streblomastix strix]